MYSSSMTVINPYNNEIVRKYYISELPKRFGGEPAWHMNASHCSSSPKTLVRFHLMKVKVKMK